MDTEVELMKYRHRRVKGKGGKVGNAYQRPLLLDLVFRFFPSLLTHTICST